MPSQSRKARGRQSEHLVADYLATHGWPFAQAVGAGRSGSDITGTPCIAVEVKARAGFDPKSALEQAEAAADGRLPFAVTRLNGQGPASIEDWPAVIRFGVLVRLLRAAGYGDAHATDEYQRGYLAGFNDHARAAQHWQDTHGAYRQHGQGEGK